MNFHGYYELGRAALLFLSEWQTTGTSDGTALTGTELRYLFVAVRICMDTFSSFEVSISVLIAAVLVLLYLLVVGIMSIFRAPTLLFHRSQAILRVEMPSQATGRGPGLRTCS